MLSLWKQIVYILNESDNKIRVDKLDEYNTCMLNKMGIDEHSALGQVVANTYGITVNGYIRILGSGDGITSYNIMDYNIELEKYFDSGKLIVANDIFGGLFAINTENQDYNSGDILYFAPDTLEWENLEITYIELLEFVSSDDINLFYKNFKWSKFEKYIQEVNYNQGILIYPFLWSKECNIEKADKKIVPFSELTLINIDYKNKFKNEYNF